MAKATAKPAIGAHISGGMKNAVSKAVDIGAQSIQIFLGSPQMWREPNPTEADLQLFTSSVKTNAIGPVFVHGNYLVNLASESPENFAKSINNLGLALRLSDRLGADGLIFHPGSAGKATYDDALMRVLKALDMVLEDYD